MAKNEQKNGILSKVALIVLALSFPVGLFVLNAPALKELLPAQNQIQKEIAVDLSRILDTKSEEIAKIDMQILEARGEILKFEEMKSAQLNELRTLYERISTMLGNKETHLDINSPMSK